MVHIGIPLCGKRVVCNGLRPGFRYSHVLEASDNSARTTRVVFV